MILIGRGGTKILGWKSHNRSLLPKGRGATLALKSSAELARVFRRPIMYLAAICSQFLNQHFPYLPRSSRGWFAGGSPHSITNHPSRKNNLATGWAKTMKAPWRIWPHAGAHRDTWRGLPGTSWAFCSWKSSRQRREEIKLPAPSQARHKPPFAPIHVAKSSTESQVDVSENVPEVFALPDGLRVSEQKHVGAAAKVAPYVRLLSLNENTHNNKKIMKILIIIILPSSSPSRG